MSALAASLAETAVALAVFFLIYRVCLRHDTHFHLGRLYLVGSLVLAFGLPFVDLPSPFRTIAVTPGPVHAVALGDTGAGRVDWGQVAMGLYLLGVGVMLVRFGWHLWRLGRLSNREPVVLPYGLRVVYLDDDSPPFSFFRTVFVPRRSEADDEDLAEVMAHERAHVRQGHSIDVLAVHLAGIVQWFNPVLWGYRSALTDVHEFLADREVLRQGHDRSAYARLLLSHHLGGGPLALAHQFRHSQIRRRLDMMTRQSGRWTIARYLLILPALALLVAAYGEPRIVAAGDQLGPDFLAPTPAAAIGASVEAPQQATGPQAEKEAADKKAAEKAAVEKKVMDAELEAKMKDLEKKYNAATDPAVKKDIAAKMKQLSEGVPAAKTVVNLSDPAAIETMITKIAAKIEVLDAKRAETTDANMLAKIEQEMKSLTMKQKELKAALAQLKGDKQK